MTRAVIDLEAARAKLLELDIAIHTTVATFEPRIGGMGWPKGALIVPAFPGWKLLPAYTASLDAAMTLVPEGMSFEVRRSGTGDRGQATVWCPLHAVSIREWRVTGCASPAHALCAAALRARAAQ
jgi:hypothetical protein